MKIELPDISEIIEKIEPIAVAFNGENKPVIEWINKQRNFIKSNLLLVKNLNSRAIYSVFSSSTPNATSISR